jgi:hypothetical protein
VTAGECLGGVRPSPGAAGTESPDAPDFIASPLSSTIAAPGDGRTPPTSLPPSLTDYPCIPKMDYWQPERLAYCTPLVELVDRD